MYSQVILTPEQLQAIGSVAVETSYLEEWVEMLIWELCGFDENTGRIFTEKMMLDAKIGLLSDLLTPRIEDKETGAEFKEIFDSIKNDIPKRNTIIHGHWGSKDAHVSLFNIASGKIPSDSVAVRKRRKAAPAPVLAKDVIKIAQRISRHRAKLMRFAVKHEALFSLPSKSL
jgi:hypothetical protein